ncbi:hypothetical protein IEQ34_024447 [Dendrobium chrysotoxum]|uniref:Uncharacterized protein n=1 Tax=Dendrobium chrysotoxum TaxID=161865 RepID=A0AAV7FS61_DENCH|nr:hypothetical protein IEQ34_024447 [Dendrobium chrysotoxum]
MARFKKGLRWIPRHPETRKGIRVGRLASIAIRKTKVRSKEKEEREKKEDREDDFLSEEKKTKTEWNNNSKLANSKEGSIDGIWYDTDKIDEIDLPIFLLRTY